MLVVPWGRVYCQDPAPKVSGAASRPHPWVVSGQLHTLHLKEDVKEETGKLRANCSARLKSCPPKEKIVKSAQPRVAAPRGIQP